MLARLSDFQAVMSRDVGRGIRSVLCFYPYYEHGVAVQNPQWNSKKMLDRLTSYAPEMSAPTGVMSFNENTIHSKGRNQTRSYMRDNPVKFGITFYANLCRTSNYLHIPVQNWSRTQSKIPLTVSCVTKLRQPHSAYAKSMNDTHVPTNRASPKHKVLQVARKFQCPVTRNFF